MIVTSASMTSLLDTLERKGLVTRERHPDDRRKVLINITDDARSVVNDLLPLTHALDTTVSAPIAESDREVVIHVLTSIRRQVAALTDRTPTPPPRAKP